MAYVVASDIDEIWLVNVVAPCINLAPKVAKFLERVVPDFKNVTKQGQRYRSTYKVKMSRAFGHAVTKAGADTPLGNKATWDTHYIDLMRLTGSWQYDGPLGTVSDESEVVDAIADGAKDLKAGFDDLREGLYLGMGYHALAVTSGSASEASGRSTYTCLANNLWPGSRRLIDGMHIDVYGPAAPGVYIGEGTDTNRTSLEDLAITIESDTTFSVAGTTLGQSSGDAVFLHHSHGSFTDALPGGLLRLIDGVNYNSAWEVAASVQDIDGTSIAKWRSTVNSAASDRSLTDTLFFQVVNDVRNKTKEDVKGSDYVLMSSPELLERWTINHAGDRQWVNVTEVVGGVPTVPIQVGATKFNWVDVLGCAAGVLIGMNTKDMVYKAVKGLVPVDPKNPGFHSVIGTNGLPIDQMTAEMKAYEQLGISRRDRHFIMRDLSES